MWHWLLNMPFIIVVRLDEPSMGLTSSERPFHHTHSSLPETKLTLQPHWQVECVPVRVSHNPIAPVIAFWWVSQHPLSWGSVHGNFYHSEQRLLRTSYWVLSMPIRKRSSVMKRLMQRFLWMVLRSVCSPRRKQKVEMQMAKQTKEITIPTHVMTDSSSSLMRPWYWKRKCNESRPALLPSPLFCIPSLAMWLSFSFNLTFPATRLSWFHKLPSSKHFQSSKLLLATEQSQLPEFNLGEIPP